MTTTTKWAFAIGVLVLAVIVALLPRDQPSESGQEDLDVQRAAAKLAPCPGGSAHQGGSGQLAGVPAQCLGDGSTIDVGSALGGKVTLVNLWATWCEPCKDELPVLQKYADRQGSASVLTVQVASQQGDGLSLLARLGVRVPTLHDGAGQDGPIRAALLAPRVLPASYVVTADGQVKLIEDPRVFSSPDQVQRAIEEKVAA